MGQHIIEITHESSLPVAQLFNALADHNNLSNVFGVPVKRIKDGFDDVNGVGSVRALGIGPLATQETVVDLEPNVSIDYEITKFGGPIMNHHGRIDFTQTSRGSRVNWTITFESFPLVGTALEKVLSTAITRGLRKVG